MPPVSPTHAHHFAEFQRICPPTGEIPICTVEQIVGADKSSEACSNVVDPLIEAGLVSWSADGLRITMPSEFRGIDLSGKNLRGIDFSFADLSGTSFNGADLRGASFKGTRLFETSFRGADLQETDFRNVVSFRADFCSSNFSKISAYSSVFSQANFANAHVSDVAVGTPLQSGSAWDNIAFDRSQIRRLKGILHSKFLIGTLTWELLKADPHTAFVAPLISSDSSGGWINTMAQVGVQYPEYLKLWVKTFREELDDPLTNAWMELHIVLLNDALRGGEAVDIWRQLMESHLPGAWNIFATWKYNLQIGKAGGIESFAKLDDLEQFGGCSNHYWTSGEKLSNTSMCQLPRYFKARERTALAHIISDIGPLPLESLAQFIREYLPAPESNLDSTRPGRFPDHATTFPAHRGLNQLTPREEEVLRLVAAGLSNEDIAHNLFISLATVKSHLNRIFRKFNVKRRTQAVLQAQRTDSVAQ